MIEYENDCCECATDGYPCNPRCRLKRNPHYYCDHCKNEDALYWYDGKQLCMACLESELDGEPETELESVTADEGENE